MKIALVVIVFLLCVGGAIIGHSFLAPPPAHSVIANDHSLSVARNCGGLRKEALRLAAQRAVQPGSTLSMLAIGAGPLNPEPLRLFDRPIPQESDDVFGQDDASLAREKAAFLSQLQSACEAAEASRNSPILRLVTQSLAHLRSRGCRAEGPCYLTVQTDLEEDVDPALRAVIQRASAKRVSELPRELAGTLDNAGITVQFCGASETQPRSKGRRSDPKALQTIWRGLFSHPELVSFQPYCGQ